MWIISFTNKLNFRNIYKNNHDVFENNPQKKKKEGGLDTNYTNVPNDRSRTSVCGEIKKGRGAKSGQKKKALHSVERLCVKQKKGGNEKQVKF